MIPTDKLTEVTVAERYVSLPDDLAAVLEDPKLPGIVQLICTDHHLNDKDRVLAVQQLVTLVLLGFVHDYDLAKELNTAAGLNNPQLAKEIADAISAKVFSAVKVRLAQNYHPVMDEPTPPPAPHIMEEIKINTPPPGTAVVVGGKTKPKVGSWIEPEMPGPAPAPFKPKPFDPNSVVVHDRKEGWKFMPKDQVGKGATSSAPSTPKPAAPVGGTAPVPTPFMLHQESEFKPIESKKFKLDLPTQQEEKLQKPAAPAAKVQIGARSIIAPEKNRPAGHVEVDAPRVVHYSELNTPSGGIAPAEPLRPTIPQAPPASPKKPAAPAKSTTNAPVQPTQSVPPPKTPTTPNMPTTAPHTGGIWDLPQKPVTPMGGQKPSILKPLSSVAPQPLAPAPPGIPAKPAMPGAPKPAVPEKPSVPARVVNYSEKQKPPTAPPAQ